MNTIKKLVQALKVGYQNTRPTRNRNLMLLDSFTTEFAKNTPSIPQNGQAAYPQYTVWTHNKYNTIKDDALPQRLFANYTDWLLGRWAQNGSVYLQNKTEFMSRFLGIPDNSNYHAVMLLTAYKENILKDESQDLIARYPAYDTSAMLYVGSHNYILATRPWWKDLFNKTRRADYLWEASTPEGVKFNMGLSRPFISSTAENDEQQRMLWVDIDLEDNSNTKIVLNILLRFRECPKQPKRGLALVIGNSEYKNVPKLRLPQNDAEAMAEVLKPLDFDIIMCKNGTKKEIEAKMKDFYERLKTYKVGLFYYSGHGIEVEKINYIVPTDFSSDIHQECIRTDEVESEMRKLGDYNRTNVIILDACRDNPYAWIQYGNDKGIKIVNNWSVPKNVPAGLVTIYSTSSGKPAKEISECFGDLKNGVFTSLLLKHIQLSKPCENISSLMKKIKTDMSCLKGIQEPKEVSNLTRANDFYFKKCEN